MGGRHAMLHAVAGGIGLVAACVVGLTVLFAFWVLIHWVIDELTNNPVVNVAVGLALFIVVVGTAIGLLDWWFR